MKGSTNTRITDDAESDTADAIKKCSKRLDAAMEDALARLRGTTAAADLPCLSREFCVKIM